MLPKAMTSQIPNSLWMRNMKTWVLVATWFWWMLFVAPTCSEGDTAFRYTTVKFKVSDATKESYSKFIRVVRDELEGDVSDQGIRRLPNPASIPESRRFLLIELSGYSNTITLVMDTSNVYLLGYLSDNVLYHFSDVRPASIVNVFPNAIRESLPFGGGYPSMRRYAPERDQIDHGINELAGAVDSLHYSQRANTIAQSLVICCGMISEAIRFRYIEGLVRQSIVQAGQYRTFRPDAFMFTVVTEWGTLSERVQGSHDGSFNRVQLGFANNPFYWDNVRQAITSMSLMLFVCATPSRSSMLIRSFVDHDNTLCSEEEITARIVGRGGLCVDVRDGDFHDGNPIQLRPCKSNQDANQLWTLKRDSTIRSNGKCLTAYGFAPGRYMMIYNCTKAVPNATYWQVWENGTIINSASGLVLNAPSKNAGIALDVQRNTYASSQAWTVTNITSPTLASIVGLNDLCVEANGDNIRLADCVRSKTQQEWALYGDGTIRPKQNPEKCLSCNGDCVSLAKIIIVDCRTGSSTSRWFFDNDGSIINLFSGLVMEAIVSDPSLKEIIAYPYHGLSNQVWFVMPYW